MANRRKNQRRLGRAAARGGSRAMRCEEAGARIELHLRSLGIGPKRLADDIDPLVLRRLVGALRAERRAARNGAGYDPLRHLALARLLRGLSGTKRTGSRSGASLKIGARR